MIEQEIERKIADFRELGPPEYVPRRGPVLLGKDLVSTVVGARRSGKSYRSLQVADEMVRDGTLPSVNHVCAIDFDNPILAAMQAGALTAAVRYLATNIAKPFTVKSLTYFLSQAGHTVGRETVTDYIRWAGDAWLLFAVPIYSFSAKEQERNYRKIYCIDWGLAQCNSTAWDGAFSRALENAVYLHLRRRFSRVHYCLTGDKRTEVDFVGVDARGKPAVMVQACMDIDDAQTLRRETESLTSAARYHGCKENLIVTYNQERVLDVEGVKVRAVPAWRWMTESEDR